MELVPRIMIFGDSLPIAPDVVVICTPATTPSRARVASDVWTLAISSDFTTVADPVNDSFVAVPKATTMVSSSMWVSGSSMTSIFALPETGTSLFTYPIDEKMRTPSAGTEME